MSADWIHDLDSAGLPETNVDADVCILGSGPVGLTLARGLAARGQNVVILELGGPTPRAPADSPPMHYDRRAYRGATLGRALGLGGTSALWGGQLLPVRPADLLCRPQVPAEAWPLSYAQIEPYFRTLQQLLGIDTAGFDLESTHCVPAGALSKLDFTGWAPRLSKWLTFDKRNVATSWKDHFKKDGRTRVWLNARTEEWQLSGPAGDRTVLELLARSAQGRALRIRPRTFVIAGGALESARAVLELNEQASSLSSGVSNYTGRFLHDHLSVRIARARVIDDAGFQERFAPFFDGPTMRSLRMEMPPQTLQSESLPALYAHFVAEADATSGFAVIRDCLRAAQRHDYRSCLTSAVRLPRALPDIARIAYARLVKRRLAFPTGSEIHLHVDFEQAPNRDNRVYLSNSENGKARHLCIDWDVDADASRITTRVRRHIEQFWERNGLNQVAELEFRVPNDDVQQWSENVYDIYHPAGTTRMAADPALGVVDTNLKIHGTSNAYVVGSSVFPSMGAANPTFTAMALALRLADFIDRGRMPPSK